MGRGERKAIALPRGEHGKTDVTCDGSKSAIFCLTDGRAIDVVDRGAAGAVCRLAVPEVKGYGRLVLSADDRWLFWRTFRIRDHPEEPVRIAVFEVADLTH